MYNLKQLLGFKRQQVCTTGGPTIIDISCAYENDPRQNCPDRRTHKWSEGWVTFCIHCGVLKSEALAREDPNTWDKLHARQKAMQKESDIKEEKRLRDDGWAPDRKTGQWTKVVDDKELIEFV